MLHKVLGQIDLGTLDSGERSLPFGLLVTAAQKKIFLEKWSPWKIHAFPIRLSKFLWWPLWQVVAHF